MNPTITIMEAREISRQEVRDALRAHAKGETNTHAVQTRNWAVVSDETGTVMGLYRTFNKCRTLPGQHIEYVPTGQRVIA